MASVDNELLDVYCPMHLTPCIVMQINTACMAPSLDKFSNCLFIRWLAIKYGNGPFVFSQFILMHCWQTSYIYIYIYIYIYT